MIDKTSTALIVALISILGLTAAYDTTLQNH